MIDEAEQVFAIAANEPSFVFCPWYVLVHTHDDSERGAELVGDVGVEAGLDGVEFLQAAGFGLG